MTTHQLAKPAPTYDTTLRTRLTALIALHAPSAAAAAAAAGWAESTLYRRLNLDPDDGSNYRRLNSSDVDQLLTGIGLPADAALQPALLPGDHDLLVWVAERTPADPLPSKALHSKVVHTGRLELRSVRRMRLQGLLDLCGDPDDQSTWYLRLTPAGQRALA